jgi:hypothetical protein
MTKTGWPPEDNFLVTIRKVHSTQDYLAIAGTRIITSEEVPSGVPKDTDAPASGVKPCRSATRQIEVGETKGPDANLLIPPKK